MAQYYQVTSLEELNRLYPNLQLENVEGVHGVIPDVAQYTEIQGQQIGDPSDQTTIQLPLPTVTSPQCVQQNQFIVHQPTQYVIQHIEGRELHSEKIQFIQQGQKLSQNKEDSQSSEYAGYKNNVNQDKLCPEQNIVKSDVSQQCLTQGPNILVLQDQESLIMNSKRGDPLRNNQGKLQVAPHRQLQKPQNISSQINHIVQPEENSVQQCTFVTQQNTPSQQISQCHIQNQQLLTVTKNADHHEVQEIPCYSKGTVIDGSLRQNVEQATMTEKVGDQLQGNSEEELQQFKIKRIPQNTTVPTVLQQVLVPQRFHLASPPPLTARLNHSTEKHEQKQDFTSPTPVYIVQKLDSSPMIRQAQTKLRLQNPNTVSQKSYDSTSQIHSKQLEKNSRNNNQITQEVIPIKGTCLQNQVGKDSFVGQVKLGVVEQTSCNKFIEQINRSRASTSSSSSSSSSSTPIRTSTMRIITTEQPTETHTISTGKEINTAEDEKVIENLKCQSTVTPVQFHHQIQVPFRGKTVKVDNAVSGIGGQQNIPKVRGVHVQTSPPTSSEGTVVVNTSKPIGAINRSVRTVCTTGTVQGQTVSQQGVSHTLQNVIQSNDTTSNSTETIAFVVFLVNGEKKIIRIPVSQQIFLGQILQQAGLSVTSPASITVEQVVNTSSSDQVTTKSGTKQIGEASGPVTTSILQQSPRMQQTTNMIVPRQHLEFGTSKFAGSTSTTSTNVCTGALNSYNKGTQSLIQITPIVKEVPRYVKGYMAICPFCGIQSLDFNKCIRCGRKLPENVKSQPIFDVKAIKPEKVSTENDKAEVCKSDLDDREINTPSAVVKGKALLIHEKKKLRPCVKKKKITEEPAEILILSSDEEEESKLNKTDLIKPNWSILKKEPVYVQTETLEKDMTNIKNDCLNEDLMKNIHPGCFTTLQCRTIRIGSYKVQPKERVLISNKGIRLIITSLKNENVIIIIPFNDIIKMLLHVGKQIPVIFVYPSPKVAVHIRNVLGMNDKSGPYYDPTSSEEEVHKRLTLLLEKISEDNKVTLHKIFGPEKLEDLSEKEANEILIRASPLEIQNALNGPNDGVRKIMVYPPPPEKGGITLNNQDYACLGEDQFLNDVIIDFYLKYLLLKVLSPEDRNRTHVFSTFFYKRLTTKPKTTRKNDPENDPKLTPAEKRHMRVKGWTKQVNLFEKDFIIVPINEHSHWFLAIICFPGLTGPVRYADNTPVEPEELPIKKNTESVQIGNTTIRHIIKSDGNTISLELDCGSDRDEAEGDQDDLQPSSEDEENEQLDEETNTNTSAVEIPLLSSASQQHTAVKDAKFKPLKRNVFKEPIKQPCILIFDSLAGASRVRVVATLRDYLNVEYKTKMGQERDFSKDTIKGAVPKVPQQNNFTDCGLYVLQYVESFFQDPLHDFKLPLKYLQEWFPEEVVSCKRQKLATLIRNLMEEQGIKVEEMGLPVLTFTNSNNSVENHSRMEDEEEEEEDGINEEEDDILKQQTHISDEDDAEMGCEEDEDDEDVEDEELEAGEIPRTWFSGTINCSSNIEPSVIQTEWPVVKSSPLVDYEGSESEEEFCTRNTSDIVGHDQTKAFNEWTESESKEISNKINSSLSMAELQDVESDGSPNKIEKQCCKSDMPYTMISDERECEIKIDEETSYIIPSVDNYVGSIKQNTPLVERTHFQGGETILIQGKTMTDIIKKLVSEKKITIRRKEEQSGANVFKKNVEIRKVKSNDCDSDVNSASTPLGGQKNIAALNKRAYQALKSVRIPKKAERQLTASSSKRQRMDDAKNCGDTLENT